MPSEPLLNDESQSIWEQRYQRTREQGGSTLHYDAWLERWQHLLPSNHLVLDLGCGSGHDSRWLTQSGYTVIAADFSFQALRVAVEAGIQSDFLQFDLRDGIPFPTGKFGAVVANLSLHYFPWPHTLELLRQLHACLMPGGVLLARFNSTRDSNFGAEGYPPIEPNAFLVDGMYKRYFDRPSLEELFANNWNVTHMEEMTIHRYRAPKVLWEVVAIPLEKP